MSDEVTTWICPECDIHYDANKMFIAKYQHEGNFCDHCIQHGLGENQLEVLEYAEE